MSDDATVPLASNQTLPGPSSPRPKELSPASLGQSLGNLGKNALLQANRQAIESLANEVYVQSHLHEKAGLGNSLGFISQTASRSAIKAFDQLIDHHQAALQPDLKKGFPSRSGSRPFPSSTYRVNYGSNQPGIIPARGGTYHDRESR